MQKRARIGALIVASCFTLQAQAAMIPVGIDIGGYLELDRSEGQGNGFVEMDYIDSGALVPVTSISGPLETPSLSGTNPIGITRLSDTNSGFSFNSAFNSDGSVANAFEFAEASGIVGFGIDNQTVDNYKFTWRLIYDLAADATNGDYVETYFNMAEAGAKIFGRELYSDSLDGDQIIKDDVSTFPMSAGGSLINEGVFSFMQTVNAGQQTDFEANFGFLSFLQASATDQYSAFVNFQLVLTDFENLTNINPPPPPPPSVSEPAPLALMLLSLGLLGLRRRK